MRRAALLAVALHLVGAAPFVVQAVLPAPVPIPAEPVMARIEMIQENTPTVGDNPPAPAAADHPAPAETAPAASAEPAALPPAAPSEQAKAAAAPVIAPPPEPPGSPPRGQPATPEAPAESRDSFAPAIRLGDLGEAGTGLVSGSAVIPAGPDSKVRNLPPTYPAEAARRGEEGVVVLLVQIAPDGSASAVDVRESSGYEVLDRAASGAVARWHFRAAVQGGMPIASTMEVEVHFEIKRKS